MGILKSWICLFIVITEFCKVIILECIRYLLGMRARDIYNDNVNYCVWGALSFMKDILTYEDIPCELSYKYLNKLLTDVYG